MAPKVNIHPSLDQSKSIRENLPDAVGEGIVGQYEQSRHVSQEGYSVGTDAGHAEVLRQSKKQVSLHSAQPVLKPDSAIDSQQSSSIPSYSQTSQSYPQSDKYEGVSNDYASAEFAQSHRSLNGFGDSPLPQISNNLGNSEDLNTDASSPRPYTSNKQDFSYQNQYRYIDSSIPEEAATEETLPTEGAMPEQIPLVYEYRTSVDDIPNSIDVDGGLSSSSVVANDTFLVVDDKNLEARQFELFQTQASEITQRSLEGEYRGFIEDIADSSVTASDSFAVHDRNLSLTRSEVFQNLQESTQLPASVTDASILDSSLNLIDDYQRNDFIFYGDAQNASMTDLSENSSQRDINKVAELNSAELSNSVNALDEPTSFASDLVSSGIPNRGVSTLKNFSALHPLYESRAIDATVPSAKGLGTVASSQSRQIGDITQYPSSVVRGSRKVASDTVGSGLSRHTSAHNALEKADSISPLKAGIGKGLAVASTGFATVAESLGDSRSLDEAFGDEIQRTPSKISAPIKMVRRKMMPRKFGAGSKDVSAKAASKAQGISGSIGASNKKLKGVGTNATKQAQGKRFLQRSFATSRKTSQAARTSVGASRVAARISRTGMGASGVASVGSGTASVGTAAASATPVGIIVAVVVGALVATLLTFIIVSTLFSTEAAAGGCDSSSIVAVALAEYNSGPNSGGDKYWQAAGYPGRVEWCGCFVGYCAQRAGLVPGQTMPANYPRAASWAGFYDRHPDAGSVHENDGTYEPRPGDFAVIGSLDESSSTHVGIVEKYENGLVYTIEGNSGDSIQRNIYRLGSTWNYFVTASGGDCLVAGDTPEEIAEYLRSRGFSREATAAIMGVWQAESGLDVSAVEGIYNEPHEIGPRKKNAMSDWTSYVTGYLFTAYANQGLGINHNAYIGRDGKYYPGLGLAQLTGPRAYDLLVYADSHGVEWYSGTANLGMFEQETAQYFSYLLTDDFKNETNLSRAVEKFVLCYENPSGIPSSWFATRLNYAQQFLPIVK